MPNSVSIGFSTAMKTGSSRQFKRYPTTYIWVSSWLLFTVDYGLSWFILILSKGKLTWHSPLGEYRLNRLNEPGFMAGPKPMRTEFSIHHRLESCVRACMAICEKQFLGPRTATPCSQFLAALEVNVNRHGHGNCILIELITLPCSPANA